MNGFDDDAALGAFPIAGGTRFSVWSECADAMWLCLFDADDRETGRLLMAREAPDRHVIEVPGVGPGQRYGLRTDGPYDPGAGLWFDPAKLLLDPYATRIDRPFLHDGDLAAPRGLSRDTAALVPKAIVEAPLSGPAPAAQRFAPGGLVYEVNVRGFTRLHHGVPPAERGTLAALARPVVIDHLRRLGVGAVELMPIAAWIDERHLAALGLRNAWGYNPVSFIAPDPRLAPGGLADLRRVADALHAAGIALVIDVVFNHSGESDALGPSLCFRGLDAQAYYRHAPGHPGLLVNDAGTGNTVNCQHPAVRRLILHAMRRLAQAGVDGFRFDLAPVLGRDDDGFDPHAPLLAEMLADPPLADRLLIAEPWDIGPGGYQLGRFPERFLEWNDRYRDDVRRFWRGDRAGLQPLAEAVCGSASVFPPPATRTLNFVAAHDGFTLADLTAFADRHNAANGENNRDGHGENLSWNNGVEGASDDGAVKAARRRDRRALLSSLFASRGAIMLTAGDEFGHSQAGNNNAYAQDNDLTWLDWRIRDHDLEAHVIALAALRRRWPSLADPAYPDAGRVEWLGAVGPQGWEDDARMAVMLVSDGGRRLAVAINGALDAVSVTLPGAGWHPVIGSSDFVIPARTIAFFESEAA